MVARQAVAVVPAVLTATEQMEEPPQVLTMAAPAAVLAVVELPGAHKAEAPIKVVDRQGVIILQVRAAVQAAQSEQWAALLVLLAVAVAVDMAPVALVAPQDQGVQEAQAPSGIVLMAQVAEEEVAGGAVAVVLAEVQVAYTAAEAEELPALALLEVRVPKELLLLLTVPPSLFIQVLQEAARSIRVTPLLTLLPAMGRAHMRRFQ